MCVVDGSEHYPRTDPAVIMAVVDADDRILLGHAAHWPAGRWSTLAGFVEAGESLEHAVRREVRGGDGRRRRRRVLPGQPAVAVPGVAHDRLPRAGRVDGRHAWTASS